MGTCPGAASSLFGDPPFYLSGTWSQSPTPVFVYLPATSHSWEAPPRLPPALRPPVPRSIWPCTLTQLSWTNNGTAAERPQDRCFAKTCMYSLGFLLIVHTSTAVIGPWMTSTTSCLVLVTNSPPALSFAARRGSVSSFTCQLLQSVFPLWGIISL